MDSFRLFLVTCLSLLCATVAFASVAPAKNNLSDLWLPELEQKKIDIESELEELSYLSLNSGVGAVGYRSSSYDSSDNTEWVQVNLQGAYAIDTIIVVPSLWRDTEIGFVNDAFPAKFNILVGTDNSPDGHIVFEYDVTKEPLIGIAPLIVSIDQQVTSWIRIEATELSERAFDGRSIFQLSDLLAFEGNVNRALRMPVTASARLDESPARNGPALVDGILPYLMNAASDEKNRAYLSQVGIGEHPSITIDLLTAQHVSGIRLHAADQSDTAPSTNAGEFGLPHHFIIEASNNPDFTQSTTLLEARLRSIFEMGPFMTWRLPPTKARYIRLTALDPFFYDGKADGTRIGFAEIEILSEGINVARNKPLSTSFEGSQTGQAISALTDGLNLYGEILPQRQWLGELARREVLEKSIRQIDTELTKRYARQKVLLRWAIIAAVCLLLLVGFTIPYYRMLSYRKEVHIRERIAANLHDELGANLHAIGMLGDVAERSIQTPDRLIESVRRIRGLTERTGTAARHCTNMLEAQSICEDIVLEMKQDTKRLLGDHDVKLIIQGEDILHALTRRKRIDLYLFFKECLTNINRHAMATKVYIRVIAHKELISISVIDNGRGHIGEIPKSLLRRARFMRATVKLKQAKPSGTHIRLTLNTKKFRFSL